MGCNTHIVPVGTKAEASPMLASTHSVKGVLWLLGDKKNKNKNKNLYQFLYPNVDAMCYNMSGKRSVSMAVRKW